MVLKNVVLWYAFISIPDENNNYRVQFFPNEEERKKLEDKMQEVAKANNLKDPDWWGSYKETEDGIAYGAKASAKFTSKNNKEIEFTLPVYDKKALRMETVPSICNGAIANIEVEPYFVKYKNKKGLMLGLRSVQLLKYEEYTGGNPYEAEEDSE